MHRARWDAWRGELTRLEERVAHLRNEVPLEEERLRWAEVSRDAALSERTSSEGTPHRVVEAGL